MDRSPASRGFGVLMAAEAATFATASYLHRDGHIALGFTRIRGERFPGAVVPEAIIAAVLGVGAVLVLSVPGRFRWAAVGATAFAILGTLVGTAVILSGKATPPNPAGDLTYHATILVVLLASMVVPRVLRRSAPRDRAMAAEQ